MPRDPLIKSAVKSRLLRRTLLMLAVAIVAGSVATLTFGAKRIAAENAAYKGPAAPQCFPSHLGTSSVLPGTHLSVAPLPDSMDASNDTQVSLLGYPIGELSSISVSGSQSGGHSGRLEAYSQGDGASWVPSKAFDSGETVVVHGKLSLGSKSYPFAYHFTTATRDASGHPASTPKPAGKPEARFSFHTQPSFHVPLVTVDSSSTGQTAGDLFMAPYSGPG